MKTDLVIGGGISGMAACQYLSEKNIDCILYDDKLTDPKKLQSLKQMGVKFMTRDANRKIDISTISRAIVSPGIPKTHKLVAECIAAHIPIITEVDLALEEFTGSVVAVTGTNGKSTAVKMAEHFFNFFGSKALACGNIGVPATNALSCKNNIDIMVLELSSYQIEYGKHLEFSATAITSLAPDHLARHKTVKEYYETKLKICSDLASIPCYTFSSVTEELLNKGIEIGENQFNLIDEKSDFFTTKTLRKFSEHDKNNAKLAASIVSFIIEENKDWDAALTTYKPLAFRCELVSKVNGHSIINDSKSTNLESTIAAVKSFGNGMTLLIGGESKGESFTPLIKYKNKLKEVILFGKAANKFEQELAASLNIRKYATLEEAIESLGDIFKSLSGPVIFSPGCASFDEFKNFEDRGNFFSQSIMKIIERD